MRNPSTAADGFRKSSTHPTSQIHHRGYLQIHCFFNEVRRMVGRNRFVAPPAEPKALRPWERLTAQ
jgi:hypothetical protein